LIGFLLPEGSPDLPLQALIFDSVFNPYRGIETYFKVVNGKLAKGDRVKVSFNRKRLWG
jgi:GTP-binding protein LepA